MSKPEFTEIGIYSLYAFTGMIICVILESIGIRIFF